MEKDNPNVIIIRGEDETKQTSVDESGDGRGMRGMRNIAVSRGRSEECIFIFLIIFFLNYLIFNHYF